MQRDINEHSTQFKHTYQIVCRVLNVAQASTIVLVKLAFLVLVTRRAAQGGAVSSVLIWRWGATIEEVGDGKSMFSLEGKDLVWDFHNLLGLFQTDVSPRIKVMQMATGYMHMVRVGSQCERAAGAGHRVDEAGE